MSNGKKRIISKNTTVIQGGNPRFSGFSQAGKRISLRCLKPEEAIQNTKADQDILAISGAIADYKLYSHKYPLTRRY